MSGPVDPAWPQGGTVWRTKEDLLLACQLAALKAGFSQLELATDIRRGEQWSTIRCAGWTDGKSCRRSILVLDMVDRTRLELGWRVKILRCDRLEAARHPIHQGVSRPLKLPRPALTLQVGEEVTEGRDFHLLEGALRVAARRQGYYLSTYFVKAGETSGRRGFGVSCALGRQACAFLIRFHEGAWTGRFSCTEITAEHTCQAALLLEPGGKLKKRLDSFPPVSLANGVIGKPQPLWVKKKVGEQYELYEIKRSAPSASSTAQQDDEHAPAHSTSTPSSKRAAPPLAVNSATFSKSKSKMWVHNGKEETNHERKERKRREREAKTGVVETKEERRERRKAEKEVKAGIEQEKEMKAREKLERKQRKEERRLKRERKARREAKKAARG